MSFYVHVLGARAEALTTDQSAQLATTIARFLTTETAVTPDSVDIEGTMHDQIDIRDQAAPLSERDAAQ